MDAPIEPTSGIALDAMFADSSALLCAIDTPTREIELDWQDPLAGLVGDQGPQRANAMLGAQVSIC